MNKRVIQLDEFSLFVKKYGQLIIIHEGEGSGQNFAVFIIGNRVIVYHDIRYKDEYNNFSAQDEIDFIFLERPILDIEADEILFPEDIKTIDDPHDYYDNSGAILLTFHKFNVLISSNIYIFESEYPIKHLFSPNYYSRCGGGFNYAIDSHKNVYDLVHDDIYNFPGTIENIHKMMFEEKFKNYTIGCFNKIDMLDYDGNRTFPDIIGKLPHIKSERKYQIRAFEKAKKQALQKAKKELSNDSVNNIEKFLMFGIKKSNKKSKKSKKKMNVKINKNH